MTNSTNDDKGRNDCQLTWQGDDIQERLSAFVDGELPADKFEEIQQHIVSCRGCAQTVQQYRDVDNQLHKEMSRSQFSRPLTTTVSVGRKNTVRELTLPHAAPSRHWLATVSLAVAGVVVLAAFASGTFSSNRETARSVNQQYTDPFSQVFMTNVVAPLGEMALNNDVCKNQQKQVARSLDLELRLLRLDTRNISNKDDEVRKINEEIEVLMKQLRQLGDVADTSASEIPSL